MDHETVSWNGVAPAELGPEREQEEPEYLGEPLVETEPGEIAQAEAEEIPDGGDVNDARAQITQGESAGKARQLSMASMHSEMFERHTLVRNKMKELVEEIGVKGVEVSASIKVPTQTTIDYTTYDVKTTIKVDMKPAKEEE